MKKSFAAWALLVAFVCAIGSFRFAPILPRHRKAPRVPESHTAFQETRRTQHSTPSSQHRSTRRPTKHRPPSKAAIGAAAARHGEPQLRPESDRIRRDPTGLGQVRLLERRNRPAAGTIRHARPCAAIQADHGFPVTGLPEAKSLMKLGLGPHPLPPDLDTSSGAKSGANGSHCDSHYSSRAALRPHPTRSESHPRRQRHPKSRCQVSGARF